MKRQLNYERDKKRMKEILFTWEPNLTTNIKGSVFLYIIETGRKPNMEETTIFYSSLSIVVLFLAFKLLFQSKPRCKNLPPSPPSHPIPIIGHLHSLKPPLHRPFFKLSQKLGPVFSLRLGSRLAVVVSSPSLVEECFTKNDIVLANRPNLLMGKILGYNNTTVISAPYGDHWRNLRRISTIEIFSSNHLNMFHDIRKDEVRRLLLKLSRNFHEDFAKTTPLSYR
ncbi:hypothetical protein REPUB_Repub10bG0136700 [Reevesia pubescens]